MSTLTPTKPVQAAAKALSAASAATKPAAQVPVFKERYTRELTKMLSQLVMLR